MNSQSLEVSMKTGSVASVKCIVFFFSHYT